MRWGQNHGLFLNGHRKDYSSPSDHNANEIPKKGEDLIMLIGKSDGTGTYYNLTKCPQALLNPISKENYNGIMLDIEASIYPPVLYALLDLIKRNEQYFRRKEMKDT